ncbi:hypothetical protein F2Q70_00004317 [Brassica cretica]|uniref:Uncharacterized protein n=1 Tax=Brassica cretica TaxID=69181 RepID=A0A8S9ILW2_BRACR|nr:hypothetical protein F2Q70_00004317 [Brassica cretica]
MIIEVGFEAETQNQQELAGTRSWWFRPLGAVPERLGGEPWKVFGFIAASFSGDCICTLHEHGASMCFSEHGGTLMMSWRSWPVPHVDEYGLLGAKPCLGGCRIGELWSWTSRTAFLGGGPWDRTRSTFQRGPGASPSGDPKAGVLPGIWRNSIPEYFSNKDPKTKAGGRTLEAGGRNPEAGAGTRKLE